jgi:hypothetical protein
MSQSRLCKRRRVTISGVSTGVDASHRLSGWCGLGGLAAFQQPGRCDSDPVLTGTMWHRPGYRPESGGARGGCVL